MSNMENFVKIDSWSYVKDVPEYQLYSPPKPIGYWIIGENFHIQVMKRPTDEQIQNTIEYFGWCWQDNN